MLFAVLTIVALAIAADALARWANIDGALDEQAD